MNHYKVNIYFVDQICKRELPLHDMEMKNQFKITDPTRFLLARHSRTSAKITDWIATFLLQHITSEN